MERKGTKTETKIIHNQNARPENSKTNLEVRGAIALRPKESITGWETRKGFMKKSQGKEVKKKQSPPLPRRVISFHSGMEEKWSRTDGRGGKKPDFLEKKKNVRRGKKEIFNLPQ